MKIEVEHPAFKTKRLAVETTGLFQSPQLLVNGSVIKKKQGAIFDPIGLWRGSPDRTQAQLL